MNRRRAVITGIGPITCIGHGREKFWNAILAEKSGINGITSFDPSVFRVRCAGEIADWNPEEFFSPQRLKRLDRYAQFAVVSAELALEDAQIECSRENPQDRIGVSFGTALGGVCKA
jgi:3-oxoacyl-[acyl-carrier-protein] synthase II